MNSSLKTLSLMPLLLAVALFSSSCSDEHHSNAKSSQTQQITKLNGKTMGTFWNVAIADSVKDINTTNQAIKDVLVDVNNEMSTYQKDSVITKFNNNTDTKPMHISAAFMKNIKTALKISDQSNGMYDITVGPLVDLWGFGPQKVTHAPSPEDIAIAKAKVGYKNLIVDTQHNTIAKSIPDMKIDLSSIAKGYGVDAVAAKLQSLGYHNFLVDIGGELIAYGNKHGKPWQVAIEKPEAGQQIEEVISLDHNMAMATSGNYRNFIDYDGKRAVHTINPKTGYTVQSNLLSVSVIEKNCMTADGYATALMALGADGAERFAEQYHLPVLFIYGNEEDRQPFRVVYSKAWQEQFTTP